MNQNTEYMDRLLIRADKKIKRLEQLQDFLFVAIIFAAGAFMGWAVTRATM